MSIYSQILHWKLEIFKCNIGISVLLRVTFYKTWQLNSLVPTVFTVL